MFAEQWCQGPRRAFWRSPSHGVRWLRGRVFHDVTEVFEDAVRFARACGGARAGSADATWTLDDDDRQTPCVRLGRWRVRILGLTPRLERHWRARVAGAPDETPRGA